MTLKELKNHVSYEMKFVPHFINKNDDTDKLIWNQMNYNNSIILKLLTNDFLKNDEIKKLLDSYHKSLYNILQICSESDIDYIAEYLIDVIEYCLEQSLKNELYETASNVKKFKERHLEYLNKMI